MTALQIFNEARFLSELDANDVTDAQLFVLINNAISDQVKFVAGLQEDFLVKDGAAQNLVSGTSDYTLATDVLQLSQVRLKLDGTNQYVAQRRSRSSDTELNSESESISAPVYETITQSSATEFIIRLFPTPTANVTDGLNYTYVFRPADLTTTSQVPVTPPELHPALVQELVKHLKQRDESPSGVSIAIREISNIYENYRLQIGQRDTDRRQGFSSPIFQD
jgi:hypothetical protein